MSNIKLKNKIIYKDKKATENLESGGEFHYQEINKEDVASLKQHRFLFIFLKEILRLNDDKDLDDLDKMKDHISLEIKHYRKGLCSDGLNKFYFYLPKSWSYKQNSKKSMNQLVDGVIKYYFDTYGSLYSDLTHYDKKVIMLKILQKCICKICDKVLDSTKQKLDLHHCILHKDRSKQSNVNRFSYFMDSIFNLTLVHNSCHLSNPSFNPYKFNNYTEINRILMDNIKLDQSSNNCYLTYKNYVFFNKLLSSINSEDFIKRHDDSNIYDYEVTYV